MFCVPLDASKSTAKSATWLNLEASDKESDASFYTDFESVSSCSEVQKSKRLRILWNCLKLELTSTNVIKCQASKPWSGFRDTRGVVGTMAPVRWRYVKIISYLNHTILQPLVFTFDGSCWSHLGNMISWYVMDIMWLMCFEKVYLAAMRNTSWVSESFQLGDVHIAFGTQVILESSSESSSSRRRMIWWRVDSWKWQLLEMFRKKARWVDSVDSVDWLTLSDKADKALRQ